MVVTDGDETKKVLRYQYNTMENDEAMRNAMRSNHVSYFNSNHHKFAMKERVKCNENMNVLYVRLARENIETALSNVNVAILERLAIDSLHRRGENM